MQKYRLKRKLTCQYRRHHPLFYIRPLKEEVVYLDPRVVIFRDLLSDQDIAKIKELATPRVSSVTFLLIMQTRKDKHKDLKLVLKDKDKD